MKFLVDAQLPRRIARVLVTKDSDFLNSHVLRGLPPMLLFVTTGNISNADLDALLRKEISTIVGSFSNASCIEIDRDGITVHG